MSKFTRALEKIQNERNNPKNNAAGSKKQDVYASANTATNHSPYLERGVPILKNIEPDARLVVQRFPNSFVAEQYRMLRTSLKSQLTKPTGNVILISSSIHSEGKSVTSANLAVCLAENSETRVALVDADLRRGKIADYFGFGNERQGLSNFLSNGLAIKQVMLRNYLDNLVVIPRGGYAQKPSELIFSNKFRLMINELRQNFDYVLIDAPPIMSAADAGILGREADGVLMVIQLGRTPKSVISHASMLFRQAGLRLLGYVLTHVEYQSSEYRYYHEYYTRPDEGGDQKKKRRQGRAGSGLRNMEARFNTWWDQNVIKEKSPRKSDLSPESPEMEPVQDVNETIQEPSHSEPTLVPFPPAQSEVANPVQEPETPIEKKNIHKERSAPVVPPPVKQNDEEMERKISRIQLQHKQVQELRTQVKGKMSRAVRRFRDENKKNIVPILLTVLAIAIGFGLIWYLDQSSFSFQKLQPFADSVRSEAGKMGASAQSQGEKVFRSLGEKISSIDTQAIKQHLASFPETSKNFFNWIRDGIQNLFAR
jgi:capsular exopolysaccharide synthesis family protein